MDRAPDRSEGVIGLQARSLSSAPGGAWERFEDLYRSSRDDVYAYVATLLGDRATAEDVTAVAFERAYRKRSSFDRRRGEQRAWLFGIARNAALDELRRRRRVVPLATEPPDAAPRGGEPRGGERPEIEPVAVDDGEVTLRRTAVRAALAGLAPRERELVALKFGAGLRNTEIADVLGISESAAGTLLHRTMQKLRRACDATV